MAASVAVMEPCHQAQILKSNRLLSPGFAACQEFARTALDIGTRFSILRRSLDSRTAWRMDAPGSLRQYGCASSPRSLHGLGSSRSQEAPCSDPSVTDGEQLT